MTNLDRPGMSYEEYDQPEYRAIAKKLLEPVLWQVEQYRRFGYELVGIIGIKESPNCGLIGDTGIFMEELVVQLESRGIHLPLLEVPVLYGEDPEETAIMHQKVINLLEL